MSTSVQEPESAGFGYQMLAEAYVLTVRCATCRAPRGVPCTEGPSHPARWSTALSVAGVALSRVASHGACPTCHAPQDQPCTTDGKPRPHQHAARYKTAPVLRLVEHEGEWQ